MKNYSAKNAYTVEGTAESYEKIRFTGFLGRYRYRREQNAVRKLISTIPERALILDCPCGTGRWWAALSKRASAIVAMDVSEEMLNYARKQAETYAVPISVMKGDAEHIALPDDSVDFVFSHALTKHLPVPLQYQVLAEFARVARKGVICSFGIFTHLTYEFWRRRKLIESYPVIPEELNWMAKQAGLIVERAIPCTTPLGVEHTVFFRMAEEKDHRKNRLELYSV